MDTTPGPLVQIPSTLAHEHLESPLSYDAPFPVPHPLDMNAVANANRRQRPSRSGPNSAGVRRSASSPNMRSLSTSSDSAALSADKKRNKLGYHRTSVACVHCRRRKIRCILAANDKTRCSNCVRLRKECQFYPVDQQPPHERRPRTGSRVDAQPGDVAASSSSSPSVGLNTSGDPNDPFGHLQQMSHPAHGYPLLPLGTSTMSPPASAAVHNMRFDGSDHAQHAGWDSRFFENQHIPTADHHIITDDTSQSYWKPPDTPMTPGFSPYSSAPPSGVMGPGGGFQPFSAPSRPDVGWQLGRSMSYGQIDEGHHRQDSHGSMYVPDMRRSTVDMLPPSMHSSSTSTTTSMSDLPPNALPNTTAGQPMMQQYAIQPTQWNMLPPSTPPKHADFGNWYTESSQLAKVQEEELAQFGDHLPAGTYAPGGA